MVWRGTGNHMTAVKNSETTARNTTDFESNQPDSQDVQDVDTSLKSTAYKHCSIFLHQYCQHQSKSIGTFSDPKKIKKMCKVCEMHSY